MSIDVKLEHIWNALLPILVTVLRMSIDVKPEHPWNAPLPILEYPSIITVVAVFRLPSTIASVNTPEPLNVTVDIL
jgi:hypothetical protein